MKYTTMNMEQEDKLFDLYMEGKTSLTEEEKLTGLYGDSSSGDRAWFNFLQNNKKVAPPDLEENIAAMIRNKGKSGRKQLFRILSGAAAMVSFIVLIIALESRHKKEVAHKVNFAMMDEIYQLASAPESAGSESELIYEDENIAIYFK